MLKTTGGRHGRVVEGQEKEGARRQPRRPAQLLAVYFAALAMAGVPVPSGCHGSARRGVPFLPTRRLRVEATTSAAPQDKWGGGADTPRERLAGRGVVTI